MANMFKVQAYAYCEENVSEGLEEGWRWHTIVSFESEALAAAFVANIGKPGSLVVDRGGYHTHYDLGGFPLWAGKVEEWRVRETSTDHPYVVVTRHRALVEYLQEKGYVTDGAEVHAHVAREQIEGKDVVGVLPLHLAAAARVVMEVPLDIPVELRGTELSLEQVRQFAGPMRRYSVRQL